MKALLKLMMLGLLVLTPHVHADDSGDDPVDEQTTTNDKDGNDVAASAPATPGAS